jgi:hypothetical protein
MRTELAGLMLAATDIRYWESGWLSPIVSRPSPG